MLKKKAGPPEHLPPSILAEEAQVTFTGGVGGGHLSVWLSGRAPPGDTPHPLRGLTGLGNGWDFCRIFFFLLVFIPRGKDFLSDSYQPPELTPEAPLN